MVETPIAPAEIRVSYHAITRYVQRILRVRAKAPTGCTAKEMADLHCEAAATTVEAVKAAILCPAVVLACRAGITMVTTPAFQAVMTPTSSAIVTINAPRSGKRKKIKVRSKREQKQDIKEITRRRQSRPSRQLRSREEIV